MPLLYYSSRLLLERKCDVLQLRPDYQNRAFQAAPQEERLEHMYADAAAGLQAGLDQGAYKKLVLVGKSIGTLGMALLLNEFEDLGSPVTIWITPLLREVLVVDAALACSAPSFFMVGTADSTFDPAVLGYIQKKTGAQAWTAENANHSLELPQNPLAFLDLLRDGMGILSTFLDQAL
jgi:pimeloyl-ACP methyl ester carboxylesterase